MAEKIKKFFAKKKADAKFKLAGPGRRLDTDDSSSSDVIEASSYHASQAPRGPSSLATRQAAEAALARLNSQKKDTTFNTSFGAIQAQVRREREAERKNEELKGSPSSPRRSAEREVELEASPNLAVQGVYYRCPMISEEILSKEEWKSKIMEFLYEQLEEEMGLTACLMIHSCNYNRSKVNDCVEIVCKYLDNIIANPDEPKFHKIRCSNTTFKDKVLPIIGCTELLLAAGFRTRQMEHNGVMEDFWVFERDNVEGIETLKFLRDSVKTEDRIEIELDRNVQVLYPAQASKRVELPLAFYSLSPEELKREQQLRSEAMEKQMQLKTKVMREKEEQRELRKYKFALMRIRFPDGIYLQGTFSVYEKFSAVIEFVQEHLNNHDMPFILNSPTGMKFEESDYENTLFGLKLVPATILVFQWEPSVTEHVQASDAYLKHDTMILAQSL